MQRLRHLLLRLASQCGRLLLACGLPPLAANQHPTQNSQHQPSPSQSPPPLNQNMLPSHRTPALHAFQILSKSPCIRITPRRIRCTRLQQDRVQFHQQSTLARVGDPFRHLRKIPSVPPHARLVQDHSQAVEIGPGRVGSLRRHVPFRPHKGHRVGGTRHQPDVRQFRLSRDKDDVRRLDVAVDQPFPMEEFQPLRESPAQGQHLHHRQSPTSLQDPMQRLGLIRLWIPEASIRPASRPGRSRRIVRQLHHVVERAPSFAASRLQDVHERVVFPGQGFKAADALEFPFKRL